MGVWLPLVYSARGKHGICSGLPVAGSKGREFRFITLGKRYLVVWSQ